jgi:hypothetical protein
LSYKVSSRAVCVAREEAFSKTRDGDFVFVVYCLSRMHKFLSSIPSMEEGKKRKGKRRGGERKGG